MFAWPPANWGSLLPFRNRLLLLNLSQHGCIILIKHALQNTLLIGDEIPQSTIVPVTDIVPIRPVNHWIDGYTFHRHSISDRRPYFIIDFPEPHSPPYTKVTSLPNKKRTPVPVIDFGKQLMQWNPTFVAWIRLPRKTHVGMLPLVGVIIIEPHNIQILRLAAQSGIHLPGDHVPGFKLAGTLRGGALNQVRAISRSHNMDHRFNLHEAGL